MDQLEHVEKVSVDELRKLQLDRLRWSLKHAYENVPHYRKPSMPPVSTLGDLKHLSDLAKFPFTDQGRVAGQLSFRDVRGADEGHRAGACVQRHHRKATVVGYTREDIEMWGSVMARSLRAAGAHSTDIVHIAYGYGLFTGGLGAHYTGAEALGATVIPSGGGMTSGKSGSSAISNPTSSCARRPICW